VTRKPENKKRVIEKGFENLQVWQKLHDGMLKTYKFVKFLPVEEKYNRISQLTRAASSGPANVAEGYGRYHYQENIQFCRQARGSIEEVINHILAARDIGQVEQKECNDLIAHYEECRKLVNGYIRYLKKCKNQ